MLYVKFVNCGALWVCVTSCCFPKAGNYKTVWDLPCSTAYTTLKLKLMNINSEVHYFWFPSVSSPVFWHRNSFFLFIYPVSCFFHFTACSEVAWTKLWSPKKTGDAGLYILWHPFWRGGFGYFFLCFSTTCLPVYLVNLSAFLYCCLLLYWLLTYLLYPTVSSLLVRQQTSQEPVLTAVKSMGHLPWQLNMWHCHNRLWSVIPQREWGNRQNLQGVRWRNRW